MPLRSTLLCVLVTGAFLLRLLHGILGLHPHRAWLFVDDLLAALRRSDADAQLALMVMFFAAISAPISWKKVQFQDNLTWCGWRINFLHETIELTPEKTIKLKGQLRELLKAGKVKRKLLEQVLGLLIWATSLSPELRSWLAPLYTDLHSPPGCMLSVHARLWPSFLSALDAKAALKSAVHGIFMPLGSKVLEFQGACVRTPADLPRVVPSAEHTRLSKMSKHSVEWLLQCFHLDLACPLRSKPTLACKAAADACAEGSIVGIGGWFISSNSVAWFAETWQFQEVQQQWPCLTKEAQRYIACFETLAQLALMRIAWSCEGQGVHGICMPAGTDNTASKAGVNKLFTTSWPLQVFVQLVAAWAHKHKWSVIASHIPGEHNIWADQLSRGNTSAFQARPEARVRFRPHDFWPHASALMLHPADAPWRPEHVAALKRG